MARRGGIGSFIKVAVKVSKAIDRANKRAEKEQRRAERAAERAETLMKKEADATVRRQRKAMADYAKKSALLTRQKLQAEKANQKTIKKNEKNNERRREELKSSLSMETIAEFGLGIQAPRASTVIGKYALDEDIRVLVTRGTPKRRFESKYGFIRFDQIVFSGQFASVLGVDGLNSFRKSLDSMKINLDDRTVVLDVPENRDYLFSTLWRSGTYFSNQADGTESQSWLTAYRYLLIHHTNSEVQGKDSRKALESLIMNFEVKSGDRELFSKEDQAILIEQVSLAARRLMKLIVDHLQKQNSFRLVA